MPAPLLNTDAPSAFALARMRRFAAAVPSARFAAYQVVDLAREDYGELRFLAVGPDCTCRAAPETHPDTPLDGGLGHFTFCGWVNLEDAAIVPGSREG